MSIITMLNPRRRRLPLVVLAVVVLLVLFQPWSGQQEEGVEERQVGEKSVLGMCPHVQRPLKTSLWEPPWQLLEAATDGVMVYLYSATFFTRHRGGGRTVQQVKVIAVGTNPRLYTPHCLLWYPGQAAPHSTPASVATSGLPVSDGNMSEVHQYVFTCPLPSTNPLPTHVSMVCNVPCIKPHNLVQIHKPVTDGILHQFGVCVPAARGDWPDVHVVEWLEVQRALGVSEFIIYLRDVSRRLPHTLQHYVDSRIVQLRPIPPPVGSARRQGSTILDSVSLTDCLLRNMARYRRLLVLDFNDLLVPRRAKSYSLMMRSVQWEIKDNQPDAFTFHSATFATDCTNNTRGKSILFRYLRRTEPVDIQAGFPLMLDPKKCVALSRDGCIKQSSTSLSLCWAVKPDVAISHHYQPKDEGTCDYDAVHDAPGTYDDVLMKYRLRVMAASPIKLHAWQNL